MPVRPGDEQRSGLLALPDILHGVKVAVPEGLFGAANVRLLEALGVTVRVKPRTKGPR